MNHLPVELHKKMAAQIKPQLRYDGSVPMDLWADRCRAKLAELVGMDTFKLCEPEFAITCEDTVAEFRRIHFTLKTEEHYYAHCDLLLPHRIEGKLPLCVALQGHSLGAHVSMGIAKWDFDRQLIEEDDCDYGLQAARRGYAVVCLEQRAFGECGGRGEKGTDCAHAQHTAILLGRTLIAERVWDVSRVVDAMLANYGDIVTMDGSLLVGLSGGGTATYYTACLEHRFDCYLSAGAVSTFRDSIVAMAHCPCNYVPGVAKYFDMGDMAAMIAPKKLILLNGAEDPIFPIEGTRECYGIIRSLYAAAGAPDNCRLVIGAGAHRFYEKDVWPVVHEMMAQTR